MGVRNKKYPQNEEIAPHIPMEKGIEILKTYKKKGEEILSKRPIDEQSFYTWATACLETIKGILGSKNPHVRLFHEAGAAVVVFAGSKRDFNQINFNRLTAKLGALSSLIEHLETTIELGWPRPSISPQQIEPENINPRQTNIFNGPVANFQTGTASRANVMQTFSDDKAQWVKALAEIREDLKNLPQNSENDDVLEIIDDADEELNSPSTNQRKLCGYLHGIISYLGTLGKAGSAYQLLKAAAASMGYPLP